jgi:AcrR family transcriptional regulator
MRKTKEEAEATRQKIIDAALELFKNRGFEATRLQDIAKATGLSRGAIYWHFKNKQDILITLMSDMRERFEQLILDFQHDEGSAVEKLKRVIQAIMTTHAIDGRFQDLVIVMMSNYQLSEYIRKDHFKEEFPSQFIGTIRDVTQQGIDEGSIRRDLDPVDVAWMILLLFTGSIIANLKFPRHYTLSEKSARIADCFMNGILA